MSALSLPLRRVIGRVTAPLSALLAPSTGTRLRTFARRHVVRLTVALTTVYLVWGSTYLAMEVAIRSVPPLLLLAVRFAVAGVVVLAWSRLRGGALGRLTWPMWRHAASTAAMLLVVGTGLTGLAQTRLTSGTAALLASTVPIWLALFARGAFGERLSWRAWAGLATGLAGVAVLVDPAGGGDLIGMLLVLLAAAAWAGGSLRSRAAAAPRIRTLTAVGLEMLAAAPMFAVGGVLLGEPARVEVAAIRGTTLAAFVYLTFAGSLVAFTAYRWLLSNGSTTLVGTFAYVNPVVAVLLGWWLLGETVDARLLAGGGVIVVAVCLLVTGRPGEPIPAQATSGGDVFAGARRWRRVRRTLGRLPRPARLYRTPGAPPFRDVGYELHAGDGAPPDGE